MYIITTYRLFRNKSLSCSSNWHSTFANKSDPHHTCRPLISLANECSSAMYSRGGGTTDKTSNVLPATTKHSGSYSGSYSSLETECAPPSSVAIVVFLWFCFGGLAFLRHGVVFSWFCFFWRHFFVSRVLARRHGRMQDLHH
jgi:hypothetical protein